MEINNHINYYGMLYKEVEHSGIWVLTMPEEHKFQLEHLHLKNSFIINIEKKTCTCNFLG